MSDNFLDSGDSPELEALFDSIALQNPSWSPEEAAAAESAVASVAATLSGQMELYAQIGQITRKMHDALRELGFDKSLSKVAEAIPDAKGRLNYIADLTENAAERVLNATDIARPIQDQLERDATGLSARWDKLYANELSVEEFKQLADATRSYLAGVPGQTGQTNTQLLDIVMAQDFQDLTGQVIKKVMEMVGILENELLSVLIAHSPVEKKVDLETSLLNGPVVNPAGRTDVVTNQQQVDDLLESLGF